MAGHRLSKSNIRSFLGGARWLARDCFITANQNPIFVFGNAKSGTTIISHLISRAAGLSLTSDIIRAIPDACLAVQLEHQLLSIESIAKKYRFEFSKDIIKEPVFTPYASRFMKHFKHSRAAFVFRDPRDNLRSILQRLKIPGHLDWINPAEWPEVKKTKAWKMSLLGGWWFEPGSNQYIEALAQTWNRNFLEYRRQAEQYVLIRYEDFVARKSGEIERAIDDLGLRIKYDISPEVDKQMQPKGDHTIAIAEFFGESNLARIESICAEGISALNYPKSVSSNN